MTMLQQQLLDLVFGAVAYTPATTLYVALSTTAPSGAGSSVTGVTEPTTGSYARVPVLNTATAWPASSTEEDFAYKANGVAITFNEATAAWGTVSHFVVYDAATAGNVIAYGPLTTAIAVVSTDTVRFAVGQIVVRMA